MPTAVAIHSCGSAPCSAPGSPRNRLKFLCSHGGKILPRPGDGQLKYVGGETRVISIARDIPFQEVMKRLTYLIDGEMILKYQLISEDLDALVTVKSDEDLVHMFDEIVRHETIGSPRMRAFLFTSKTLLTEPLLPEQRYIYSINGVTTKQIPSSPSSACSSPRSPHSFPSESPRHKNNMHKTLSSQHIRSPHGQHHPQYYHNSGRNGAAPERLVSVRSVGRVDGITTPPKFYRNINRARCLDACSHFADGRFFGREATLP